MTPANALGDSAPALYRTAPAPAWTPAAQPTRDMLEHVACPLCGSDAADPLATAEEDLTGKPGRFTFVRCRACGLGYQSPRIRERFIGAYYDDDYIAYRRKTSWGLLTPLYRRAMAKLDRRKAEIAERYRQLGPRTRVLDVGCGAGSFLAHLRTTRGCTVTGVDFKDLSDLPWLEGIEFLRGAFGPAMLQGRRFDLVTMWHFLEHDYHPLELLRHARSLLAEDGLIIIEVPNLGSLTRRLYGDRWPGLQAPQHTILLNPGTLRAMAEQAGLEVIGHLRWGAFPAYFYLFAGLAFTLLRGKGLNLDRAILPYFLGQILLAPLLLFERRLDLAMQAIVCRKTSIRKP